jgi:hypothetical protein
MNNIDTKAKCRHLKRTLLQVFIRVDRQEIQSVHVGIFDPAL